MYNTLDLRKDEIEITCKCCNVDISKNIYKDQVSTYCPNCGRLICVECGEAICIYEYSYTSSEEVTEQRINGCESCKTGEVISESSFLY